jgi:NAD(P)H dehydrogenase (quinone)
VLVLVLEKRFARAQRFKSNIKVRFGPFRTQGAEHALNIEDEDEYDYERRGLSWATARCLTKAARPLLDPGFRPRNSFWLWTFGLICLYLFRLVLNKGNSMAIVAVVYHSGFGHTKLQAEAVHRGVASVKGIEAKLYTTDEATNQLAELDQVDAIIFGCPTYMGSMSAEMKKFIEVAAQKWFTQSWKDKVAGAFTNSSSFSGDKLNTLIGLVINAMQHSMIYVGTGLLPAVSHPESLNSVQGPGPEVQNRLGSFVGPMSASFQVPPGDAPPPGDIATAESYGARVAQITLRLKG